MWYVALGWHAMEFAQTSAVLEFYIWLRFWPYHRSRHVILHQSAKFYPNQQKKMTSCRFSRWRISAILDFRDPIMGSLKSPFTHNFLEVVNRHHSSKLLSFWENRVFAFWRQTDSLPDGQARCICSRCRERRLNKVIQPLNNSRKKMRNSPNDM